MTPAEKRIKEQVDRWLTSVDLHLQYTELNDFAYNRLQNWPVHDRPNKLVLDLAKQKTLELRNLLAKRREAGDTEFADAMELMTFLVNLVGSQHVQRYIPLAEPPEQPAKVAPVVIAPPTPIPSTIKPANVLPLRPAPQASPVQSSSAQSAPATKPPLSAPAPIVTIAKQSAEPAGNSVTVEHIRKPTVPELADTYVPARKIEQARASSKDKSRDDDNDATREMPRAQRLPAGAQKRPATKQSAPVSAAAPSQASKQSSSTIEQLIVVDAVRLTNWGRKWHELAEAIARIADRPSVGEIRKILRTHRDEIQRRAAEPQ